ncbi:glutamine synthetase beta-grasp domain-containing protein [Planctomycetaceae bacterium SH139]
MITETTTPQSVLALCRELDIKSVALRFTSFIGQWQHYVMPVSQLGEQIFEDGVGITARELSGWNHGSPIDLLLVPEPASAFVDPFAGIPTLNLICGIQDPITRDDFSLDPRSIAHQATSYLTSTGMLDQTLVAFESEYYLFDSVRYRTTPREAFVSLNGGQNDRRFGLGQPASLPSQENLRDTYSRWSAPPDSEAGFRDQVVRTLQSCGVPVVAHQVWDAQSGQQSLLIGANDLVKSADAVMITKYVVKGVAKRLGRTATFMPKPVGDHLGSGLHTQLDFHRGGDSLFAGTGYGGLSDQGLHAIGGLLNHAGSLAALACPTTNSYRRLATPQLAPNRLAFSHTNRTSAVRVPTTSSSPKHRRIEFRPTDASSNPYLAFSAIAMAALDGIQQKLLPGSPADPQPDARSHAEDSRSLAGTDPLSTAMLDEANRLPETLADALAAIEIDHDYLTRGDVFTPEAVEAWIDHKRRTEIAVVAASPHPTEFDLYYDT